MSGQIKMLRLSGKAQAIIQGFSEPRVLTVTDEYELPKVLRENAALLLDPDKDTVDGFGAYVTYDKEAKQSTDLLDKLFIFPDYLGYIQSGDIVRFSPEGSVRCLFRKTARYNTILLTERCDQYCLMCSQPPKDIDDSWLLDQAMTVIETIPRDTKMLGFSGGEPTLYGDGLVKLVGKCKSFLPHTGIDILTNGRAFADASFAKSMGAVGHPNCTFCVPLYSDDPVTHNYVVQHKNAFDDAVQGILNLKSQNQKVEIRIVIHKQTIDRLVQTCEFIARNLIFVDHVALMGLEITGFTRANLDKLWIDPFDYKDTLSDAIKLLNSYGMSSSVYNHQLCTVNEDVLGNYVRSISDWKNEFVDECADCSRMSDCGGFFSSSKQFRYSDNISPF